MSTMPTYPDNSAPPVERRLQARQPVSALAYLDIGADNGGIALNLSESGMALQAVAPLESKADVNLRIQLPHSQSRIETRARIVWLGQSNRQVGVRFVDMPADARAQIREWIRSQGVPATPLEVSIPVPQKETPASSLRGSDNVAGSQNDKWLSLMAEFETARPSEAFSDQKTDAGARWALPPASDQPVRPTSGIVLNPFSARINRDTSLPNKDFMPVVADQTPEKPVEATPKTESTAALSRVESLSQRTGTQTVVDWPAGDATTAVESAPTSADLAVLSEPVGPLATTGPSPGSDAITPGFASVLASLASARKRSSARKWAGSAALFVAFCGLCFGIGTWFGSQRTEEPAAQRTALATNVAPVSVPAALPPRTEPEGPTTPVPTSTTKSATENVQSSRPTPSHSSRNRVHKTETAEPVKNSPLVLPARQEFTFAPPPVPVVTKPVEKAPTQAPAPSVAAAAPATTNQTIIAGHVLKPTDRFNPCHLTYRLEPTYPSEARQQRLEGAVKIHLTVGTDGDVRNVKLISGPPLLALAALDAAQYWRYMPALLNGEPIESEQDVEIDFRLPR